MTLLLVPGTGLGVGEGEKEVETLHNGPPVLSESLDTHISGLVTFRLHCPKVTLTDLE